MRKAAQYRRDGPHRSGRDYRGAGSPAPTRAGPPMTDSLTDGAQPIETRPTRLEAERDRLAEGVAECAQHPGEWHTSNRLKRQHKDVPVEMTEPSQWWDDHNYRAHKQQRLRRQSGIG